MRNLPDGNWRLNQTNGRRFRQKMASFENLFKDKKLLIKQMLRQAQQDKLKIKKGLMMNQTLNVFLVSVRINNK
jgi:hypothetical protein